MADKKSAMKPGLYKDLEDFNIPRSMEPDSAAPINVIGY